MKNLILLALPVLITCNYAVAKPQHPNPKKKVVKALKILKAPLPYAKSYVVYDFTNNRILQERNSNQIRPIASLTKLMTANVFLNNQPNLKSCHNYLNNEDIDYLKNTHSRLPMGYNFTCDNLLNAMLISSDNMAASALARSIHSKSKSQFIEDMNKEAKQIGMANTYYADSSGLSPSNKSTAQDLLALMKRVLTKPFITHTTAKKNTVIAQANGKLIGFKNTNRLIREYGFDADLSKTGYIRESGYNLIYVHKNLCQNKKIGLVLLGSNSSASRSEQALNILKNYGCLFAKSEKI